MYQAKRRANKETNYHDNRKKRLREFQRGMIPSNISINHYAFSLEEINDAREKGKLPPLRRSDLDFSPRVTVEPVKPVIKMAEAPVIVRGQGQGYAVPGQVVNIRKTHITPFAADEKLDKDVKITREYIREKLQDRVANKLLDKKSLTSYMNAINRLWKALECEDGNTMIECIKKHSIEDIVAKVNKNITNINTASNTVSIVGTLARHVPQLRARMSVQELEDWSNVVKAAIQRIRAYGKSKETDVLRFTWPEIVRSADRMAKEEPGSMLNLLGQLYVGQKSKEFPDGFVLRDDFGGVSLGNGPPKNLEKNYYDTRSGTLYLNKYKEAALLKHGKQIRKFPPKLKKLVDRSLREFPRKWLISQANGEPYAEEKLSSIVPRAFPGLGATINDLRHALVSHVHVTERASPERRETLANGMLHDEDTARSLYVRQVTGDPKGSYKENQKAFSGIRIILAHREKERQEKIDGKKHNVVSAQVLVQGLDKAPYWINLRELSKNRESFALVSTYLSQKGAPSKKGGLLFDPVMEKMVPGFVCEIDKDDPEHPYQVTFMRRAKRNMDLSRSELDKILV